MFALYFAVLFVTIALVALHIRDVVLRACVDRLFIFSSLAEINTKQARVHNAKGQPMYGHFYQGLASRYDQRIKWEAVLYKALI